MKIVYPQDEINADSLKEIIWQWQKHLTLVRNLQDSADVSAVTIQQWIGEINAVFKQRIRSKI